MPKLIVRPSAAQARVLYALYENPELQLYFTEPRFVQWNGGGKYDWQWNHIYGKVRPATMRALIREEWIGPIYEDGDWNQRHTYKLTEHGREVAAELTPADTVPKHKGVSVYDIHRALRKRYQPREWIYLQEVRLGTGWGSYFLRGYQKRISREQRVDGLAINTYESKSYRRIAFEIKIARGDFLKEIKNPDKRIGAQMISNQLYFVAPEGMIEKDEVPDGCGLLDMRGDMIKLAVQAPYQEAAEWHPSLVASVLRSAVSQR